MNICKDCYWFYHVPECFADRTKYGKYMCANRDVKKIKVDKDMSACSFLWPLHPPHPEIKEKAS